MRSWRAARHAANAIGSVRKFADAGRLDDPGQHQQTEYLVPPTASAVSTGYFVSESACCTGSGRAAHTDGTEWPARAIIEAAGAILGRVVGSGTQRSVGVQLNR